jgi:hypothetical protein
MVAGRFIMIKLDLKFVMLAMRMVFLGALLVFLMILILTMKSKIE